MCENGVSSFLAQFPSYPILLPVIHVCNPEQAISNAKRALIAGCDGLWLICHGQRTNLQFDRNEVLSTCYSAVRKVFPEIWIGVNSLPLMHRPTEVFSWVQSNCPKCNGIWMDNAFSHSIPVMERIQEARVLSKWNGTYFGGVAFKHQDKVHPKQNDENPPIVALQAIKNACQMAKRYVDIIITSGGATGEVPSVAKITAMHSVATPLAVSGCGLAVTQFREHAEIFLCATALSSLCTEHGILDKCESSFCELSPEKLSAWVCLGQNKYKQKPSDATDKKRPGIHHKNLIS